MKTIGVFKTISLGASVFLLSGLLPGCLSLSPNSISNFTSSAESSLSGGSGGSAGPAIAMGSIAQQQMDLGTSLSVPVQIQSQGYSGMVNLSVDNKVLAANDPMSTISVSISPSSVNLSAGGSAKATVNFVSTASSPDLSSFVNVIASTASGQVVQKVPIQVNAVFEIDILSSGDLDTTGVEDWSVPGGSTTKFTTHVNGVVLKFVNKDPVENSGFYRIHSSATAYLHQGGEGLGAPGSTATTNDGTNAVTVGNTYTVTVTSQASQLSNTSYDHNNENPSKASRQFVFNAFSAPPVIGDSGNPNASFAYIQTNMINTTCVSCHSNNTSSMGGGISFATYSDVLPYLQPGSAQGSAFYVQIAPGGMMPQNDPGSVSAPIVQDVQDWINDGALNN